MRAVPESRRFLVKAQLIGFQMVYPNLNSEDSHWAVSGLKGGSLFRVFWPFFQNFEKKKFFFLVFQKGPWVPSKGQKKFGPAVIFVGNMANSKFRPFGASLRGGFFKMAISRPRSKISKFYLIRASSGSRGPPLGHKKHQKSKTHMCDF